MRRTIAATSLFVCLAMPGAAPRAVAAPAQPYNWKNVVINGGGFIPGIVFSPREPNLIYVRTDMGGAYRWNQGTQSWTQLLAGIAHDDWSSTGVESLAPDPIDPN